MSARKDIIFPSYMLINPLMYSAEKDDFVEDWDKLSPSLTLGGTGIGEGSDYILPAREDTLKRFRVSVASIQAGSGPTEDVMLQMDSANLYFGVQGGAGSAVPVGGAPSATVGTRANGLPVKFQKVHFFASQYPNAFKDGPAVNASATSMSNDPAEYCCYMLCSSPVKVNRAPHPTNTTQDSSTEGAEQTQTVADWIPEGYFNNRLTIGGAPLTKVEVITGVERLASTPGKITFKKGFVYAAFPTDSSDQDMNFQEINYIDSSNCKGRTAYVLSDGAAIAEGTEADCIGGIYDILDCICSGISQLTGADGTYIFGGGGPDCCGNTTTTTTTTTPIPCDDADGMVEGQWYIVEGSEFAGEGTPVLVESTPIIADPEPYCPFTVIDGPFDCTDGGVTSTTWYRINHSIGLSDEAEEWVLGSAISADPVSFCPFTVQASQAPPDLVDDKNYCIIYHFYPTAGTSHEFIGLGSDFETIWAAATEKAIIDSVAGPFDTYGEAETACT